MASLAWQDYRNDAWLSACSVLALVAVIAPLLVLFGLKFGLVSSLTERLETDPATREIIPLGGGRFSSAFVEQLGQRSDVAFALPRTRQIAATAQVVAPELRSVGDTLLAASGEHESGLLVMGGAFVCLIAGIIIIVGGAGRLERAQRDLLARSSLLKTTLESLRDPICVIDAEGWAKA